MPEEKKEEVIDSKLKVPERTVDQTSMFGLGERQAVKYDFEAFKTKKDNLMRRLYEEN